MWACAQRRKRGVTEEVRGVGSPALPWLALRKVLREAGPSTSLSTSSTSLRSGFTARTHLGHTHGEHHRHTQGTHPGTHREHPPEAHPRENCRDTL